MTLKSLKDYIKEISDFDGSFYIGKIDKTKDKAMCFYPNKSPKAKRNVVGGKANKSFTTKAVTILLRYGQNADMAEDMASQVQNFFDEKTLIIDNRRVFVIPRYEEPIPLGTDDRGIYEYSFIFDFYENKRSEING